MLTLYELVEGEETRGQGMYYVLLCFVGSQVNVLEEFRGMDMDVLRKSLHVLVKRGKAQVFGSEDQQGVKFF